MDGIRNTAYWTWNTALPAAGAFLIAKSHPAAFAAGWFLSLTPAHSDLEKTNDHLKGRLSKWQHRTGPVTRTLTYVGCGVLFLLGQTLTAGAAAFALGVNFGIPAIREARLSEEGKVEKKHNKSPWYMLARNTAVVALTVFTFLAHPIPVLVGFVLAASGSSAWTRDRIAGLENGISWLNQRLIGKVALATTAILLLPITMICSEIYLGAKAAIILTNHLAKRYQDKTPVCGRSLHEIGEELKAFYRHHRFSVLPPWVTPVERRV